MVSVAIATYNGEKYIYDQIRTVLDNLNSEDEVIISDDNSNDKTILMACGNTTIHDRI